MVQKKAALGLSIETLVIIIISLVILGAGVSLLYKFILGAERLKADLDQRTEVELKHLLTDQGKIVALPFNNAEVERGNNHVFGIGILHVNFDDELLSDEFKIKVELAKAVDERGTVLTAITPPVTESWLLYNKEILTIKENEHKTEGIMVTVPKDAQKGQYIFNARVYSVSAKGGTETQYGNTQKFTVMAR